MPICISPRKAATLAGRHPFIVGMLGTLLALGVLSISLLTLLAARETALRHADENSRNVVAVLVSNIARTIDTSDQSLLALMSDLNKPEVRQMNSEVRHELLFSRTTAARHLTGMGITDANGQLFDGCCSANHHWDFSDRDYYLVHRQSANVGLYVSKPYHARSRSGVEAMALSRRINGPDGSFQGVALVAVDLEYFRQLLAGLDVGPHGITAIVRIDGSLMARNPPLDSAKALYIHRSPAFPRMVNRDSGSYTARSASDGVLRLYTFRRVPGTPLIAVVAPAQDDVLASWKRLSWVVGLSASAISIAFCAVVWALAFALRDRVEAEHRLRALTQTDPLTGLKNRRALDDTLDNEWDRLQRNNSSLSVLFVDADHFKQYNDEHGHAQGDVALTHIAACVGMHARRRGDLAARYGGEEFIVVLPDTDEAGAREVAEAIRAEVEHSWQADASRHIGSMTVSVGCATGRRATHASLLDLAHAADMALYEAKRRGRNCVVTSGERTA